MKELKIIAILTACSSQVFASSISVGPKIGHQNMAFSAKHAKTKTDISVSYPDGNAQTERNTNKARVSTGYNNTVVAGVRGTYSFDTWRLVGDFDNARYHFNQGFTDVYGLSFLSEVPFFSAGSFRAYGMGGLSFKWIKSSFDVDESSSNFSLDSDIEPIEALNLEAGLGSVYKIAENFSMNLEYKFSDTIASDGNYIRMKTAGRTENHGIIRTSSRTELESLKATIQELSIIANWMI
jgi:opacity protein-like surface antigen